MDNPIISVIVPVYNVEKYLERCVNSISSQTYSNWECLLIDDGSTDQSGMLCDRLADEDKRIRVIHKENGGLSDARNTGLKQAIGEFVCFIDSDDFIAPQMLQTLYSLIEEHQADMAVCGICDCYETGSFPQSKDKKLIVCSGAEALQYTLEGKDLPGSVCSKLIRRDLCKDLYFVVGKTYEDAFYTPELCLRAGKVAATTESLYNYWHRADSITSKPFSPKNMDVIDAYQYTLDTVRLHSAELEPVAQFRLDWAHFVVLDKMLEADNWSAFHQYKQIVAYLKKRWLNILRCQYFARGRRVSAIALKMNVRLYRILAMANKRKLEVNQ